MPPRYPHGLKKNPLIMSSFEKMVFGILTLSIGTGMFQIVTSPWSEKQPKLESSFQQQQQAEETTRKDNQ